MRTELSPSGLWNQDSMVVAMRIDPLPVTWAVMRPHANPGHAW
jgi:hypothetical protein